MTMQETNQEFDVTVRFSDDVLKNGTLKNFTIVHHRHANESVLHYQSRHTDFVLYAKNTLSNVERIQAVQFELLCAGRGLSNCIVTEVGPLRDMT